MYPNDEDVRKIKITQSPEAKLLGIFVYYDENFEVDIINIAFAENSDIIQIQNIRIFLDLRSKSSRESSLIKFNQEKIKY